MSVTAEAMDKTTEKTSDATEAYVNENKWQVCHNMFSIKFLYYGRPVPSTLFAKFIDINYLLLDTTLLSIQRGVQRLQEY